MIILNVLVTLKDKSVHVLYSDNVEEETVHLIPESQWDDEYGNYDPEFICSKEYPYSEIIERTDQKQGDE